MPGDRVLTRNRMGWCSSRLSPLSQQFIEWISTQPRNAPVLDIGAGLGTATLAALASGANVIANDIDGLVLAGICARASQEHGSRLATKQGRFPREINFQPGSLLAVHASSVFHFLTGRQLEEGMRAIARWLIPGGHLFVQTATPFQAPFADFIPEYEARLAGGDRWPGWLPQVSRISSHRQLSQMPRSLHLLDHSVLARMALESGLIVEKVWLYRRPDLPATLHWDGRETAALIAFAPEVSPSS